MRYSDIQEILTSAQKSRVEELRWQARTRTARIAAFCAGLGFGFVIGAVVGVILGAMP